MPDKAPTVTHTHTHDLGCLGCASFIVIVILLIGSCTVMCKYIDHMPKATTNER